MAEIETQRLVLRLPEPDDLDWQRAWLNTPAVRRHLGGPAAEADFAAGFARNIAAFGQGLPGFFTVLLRDTGEPIGKCGLSMIEAERAPPVLAGEVQAGWTLADAYWGRGYASEAARAMIAHAFMDRELTVLWAQTSESNVGSTRVMARLGFRRIYDLDYVDPDYPAQDNPTTVYRITREEWGK